jgi:tetratricopeptide (TPR) repeat protein
MPARAEAILERAQAAFNAGRIEEAVEKCREAIQLDPRSTHGYYLLGIVEARRGRQKEALRALLQAAKLEPSNVAVHLLLGKVYLQADDLVSAKREFQKSVDLGEASAAGEYGLGLVMIAQSQFSEALPHLQLAVKANPKDPERLLTLTATQLQLLQMAEAGETVRQVESFPALDPSFLYRLGNLLLENKLTNEAQSAYERAIATLEMATAGELADAKRLDLYFQAARLRFNHHDYRRTIRYLEAVRADNEDAQLRAAVLDMRGASLLAIGDIQKALANLVAAVQTDASKLEYALHLTWAELMAGDTNVALDTLKKTEDRWANAPEVRQMRTFLEREKMPPRSRIRFMEGWHLKGEGLVCCPCPVPCPCRCNAAPPQRALRKHRRVPP